VRDPAECSAAVIVAATQQTSPEERGHKRAAGQARPQAPRLGLPTAQRVQEECRQCRMQQAPLNSAGHLCCRHADAACAAGLLHHPPISQGPLVLHRPLASISGVLLQGGKVQTGNRSTERKSKLQGGDRQPQGGSGAGGRHSTRAQQGFRPPVGRSPSMPASQPVSH